MALLFSLATYFAVRAFVSLAELVLGRTTLS
jgi:hypothetical protein